MPLDKELSYDKYFDAIKGIQFYVKSPKEIVDESVAEINNTETNPNIAHGLFDSRMGVTEFNQICPTCHQKNTFCPGHFAHITLAKPVFYIQFYDIVRRLLKCVCTKCSKLLVDPESDEVKAILNKKLSRQKRWDLIYNLCTKKKRCGQDTIDGCGTKVPKITRESMLKIGLEWKLQEGEGDTSGGVKKHILMPEDVHRIFRRISDRDADIMGFCPKYNRPEWMVCTVLPVPPPAVRPSVRSDNGARQEDDLTHKLSMILKVNNNLLNKLEKGDKIPKEQIDMLNMLLQWEVTTMIDNQVPGIQPSNQRTGRPMRSVTQRLKSKEGRIRGNLMGKRVDFSARSVITPDPNISIDELGVPLKIAMNLTFPEMVSVYNMEEIRMLVRNGPDVYPGAKFIKKAKNGATYRLKSNTDTFAKNIEVGDVVDRHLRNGDPILFNRQPSLHRMSMMTHRARVMPFNTFRINVCVTAPYNAD